jgi:hypothetical protein
MSNMLQTVIPKSDQLNADSLIGGKTMTIKVTNVSLVNGDQPVAIDYEGGEGKPYKPCKSMRRVLIHCWGGDSALYSGRSMTLYCDPAVKFGGADVGGIRISHLSHIDKEVVVMLTATRANRKPFTVKPLVVADAPNADDWIADIESVPTLDGLKHKYSQAQKLFKDSTDFARIHAAKEKRKTELTTVAETAGQTPEKESSN